MSKEGQIAVLERIVKDAEETLKDMKRRFDLLGKNIPRLEEQLKVDKNKLNMLKGESKK